MKNSTLTALTVALLASCSPKINYMGNDIGNSGNVQTFYGEIPQNKKYEVIGIATNQVSKGDWRKNKLTKIEDAMIELAKKKGADAVLFSNMKREEVGSTGGITIGTWGNNSNTGVNNVYHNGNRATQKKNVVEAKFLKLMN